MNLLLVLAFVYALTFLIGRVLERYRIPWIFASLLVGLGLSAYNPFVEYTSSDTFLFLANLGMYFLLFIIGFEMNIKEIKKQSKFIVSATAALILAEAFFGSLFIHYVFGTPWEIAVLVALSFATVGEAIILPILDEFKLVKTKLGQVILGVGIMDDLVEVITLIITVILVGVEAGHSHASIATTLTALAILFVLGVGLTKLKRRTKKIKFHGAGSFFLFSLAFIFLFIGIGLVNDATAALGAIIAGIALRNFLPGHRIKQMESEIRTIAYGFLAPLFFLNVGLETDVYYLIAYPGIVLVLMLLVNIIKVATAYLVGRKKLGKKNSVIMGIALSVKLSTSIVILSILYGIGIIGVELYSVLIGTQIVFKFVVPALLSYLIPKWKITGALHPGK